ARPLLERHQPRERYGALLHPHLALVGSVFTEVVVDCEDPSRVAGFWSDVLGWPITNDKRGFCWLSSDGGHTPPIFVFVPVPERKAAKNRLHIDVNPSGCDPPEELERLLSLG